MIKGGGEITPVITIYEVGDTTNKSRQFNVSHVKILGPSEMKFTHPEHEYGPHVWIETESDVEYD
jgi:hypothetical protein